MGLREQNAERARNQIVQAALELFRTKGFDATTMDEIAERADLGSSTLYRYFSSKDAILLHRLAAPGAMANELRRRPPDEELSVALGHAVLAVLTIAGRDEDVELEARAIIDQNPGPRSRLMDHFFQERHLLEQALADRMGRSIDDISVAMSARNAVLIMELAADRWRASDRAQGIVEVAEDVMRELSVSHINLPTAPSDAADGSEVLSRDVSQSG